MKLIFITITLLAIIVVPQITFGLEIIPCDGVTVKCDFAAFITFIKNIIDALVYIAVPLAAISFCWAGFLLISSGGSESNKEKAKSIFTKTAIGFIIVLAAWMIVYTITSVLVKPNEGYEILQTP